MAFQQVEIEELVQACEGNIIITTHHKPDADALGSSLALRNLLLKLKKNVLVVTPTDFPKFLDWMPSRDQVLIYEGNEQHCAQLVIEAEIIFCLDFNDLKRINDLGDVVAESKATKVMIDHHQEPKDFAQLQFHTTETSSTCELVYDWIRASPYSSLLDADIASCIYAGIMTDTGGFKHGNTSSKTFQAAAELLRLGVDNVRINQEILDQHSLRRFRLIGYSLNEKLRLIHNKKVAILSLSAQELERYKVQTGDTEGLVNYGLSIAGVEMSTLIIDRTIRVKMSFRSKNKFPCNIFAKENFSGGGHYNASGGQSELTLDETITKFEKVIENYSEWLD